MLSATETRQYITQRHLNKMMLMMTSSNLESAVADPKMLFTVSGHPQNYLPGSTAQSATVLLLIRLVSPFQRSAIPKGHHSE